MAQAMSSGSTGPAGLDGGNSGGEAHQSEGGQPLRHRSSIFGGRVVHRYVRALNPASSIMGELPAKRKASPAASTWGGWGGGGLT